MAVYSVTDNIYAINKETVCNAAANYSGSKIILATEREIDISLGLEQINKRKASGHSYQRTGDGRDFRKGNQLPMISLPFDGSADNMTLLLATLFQNVTKSGTYINQFDPYATSAQRSIKTGDAANFYSLTLSKNQTSTGDKNEYISGCIARSMSIGSRRGEPTAVTADIVGMTYDTLEDQSGLTGPVSWTEFGKKVIMHFDWTKAELAGVEIDLESWNITINNNAFAKYGVSQTPTEWLLGDLDITCELVFPRDFDADYKALIKSDTDYLFEIYKGSKTGATAEDFYIKCNFVPDNPTDGDTDGMKTFTMSGPGADDGTNPAIQIINATATDLLA